MFKREGPFCTIGVCPYEAPNGVHEVSANASHTMPAKFVAYFVCDREMPLSVTPISNQGKSQ